MTLQQLEYFLAAVDHGSFSAAADSLHMAQPSLSEQVRKLEAELGLPRFATAERGIKLTEPPLIPAQASWGAEDAARRQLAELAQRAGVRLEPQIDVEDAEATVELAAMGLGDTIIGRGLLLALGSRLPDRLGWVPFADP